MTSALPFTLDRPSRTVVLPGVNLDDFDPAQAITLTQAANMLRGRRLKRLVNGRDLTHTPHVHLNVARRWANPRRGWKVRLEDGEYTLRLPAVKMGGELLFMAAWVEAFERARARLSVLTSPAKLAAEAMSRGRPRA